jgi:hypothetical protein
MENISGYARVLSRVTVKRELNKPFWGEPFIKLGQCWALWSYFFHIGGILAAKYNNHLDEFGNGFLGIAGKPEAVKLFFNEIAGNTNKILINDTITFHEYVAKEFLSRINSSDDAMNYFIANGKQAEELAWQYAEQGSSIGATFPSRFKKMFDQTYSIVSKERWELYRKIGLDITPEQPHISYEESENNENKLFLDYCKEFCPKLYMVFTT